jgi:hypothetical protein
MKRSLQEIVELVVFGLIALLVGTGLLWLLGWLFGLAGAVLTWVAGLVWALLRFIVPVAIVAALVYFVVRAVQQGSGTNRATTPAEPVAPTVPTPPHVSPRADGAPAAAAVPPREHAPVDAHAPSPPSQEPSPPDTAAPSESAPERHDDEAPR